MPTTPCPSDADGAAGTADDGVQKEERSRKARGPDSAAGSFVLDAEAVAVAVAGAWWVGCVAAHARVCLDLFVLD